MMSAESLPLGLTLEKPCTNLASLTITPALTEIGRQVVAQWAEDSALGKLAKYGIFPTRQVLFYGPPGNGKTTGAQWLAAQIDVPCYRLRTESIVNCYVGQTASNLTKIMDWLENKPRCVVLVDEVENFFPSRQSLDGSVGREFGQIVTTWWQRLDRWSSPQLFILATNIHERLDPAMMSRLELQLYFGPPTAEQAISVIEYWAETLHEHGGAIWGPELINEIGSHPETLPVSFRAVWQSIRRKVLDHEMDSMAGEFAKRRKGRK